MLKKGAIHYLQPTQGEFLNNIYLQCQKRKGKSIDSEFETIEQFHNLPTFQNGSSTCHKGSSPESQFKRCVFWHTSAQECKGERKVSLGREFVRIPMFVLSSRISSSSFYETTKNPKSSVKANRYKNNDISRRYVSLESKIFSNYPGPGNFGFSIAKY